jgi:hypothetical protein
MRRSLDSDQHDADLQILELAHIFAQGVIRLHNRGHLPLGPEGLSPDKALKSAIQDLDLPADPRLSVHSG